MRAVHPDIYEMYPLQYDCVFESFCKLKGFKSHHDRVYVELSCIKDCGDILDSVLADRVCTP